MKKAFMYIGIVLAVIFFVCLGLAVFLMIAPGTEVFGIKFISAQVGEFRGSAAQAFVSQDIYLYTDNVPVTISFGKTGTLGVEFVQHYQGFTRAKDIPEIVLKNKDGEPFDPNKDTDAVHIYINQYKKFIWSNSSTDFYLNINLPHSYKSAGNIFVESKNSSVTIDGSIKTLKSLNIKTANKIKIINNLTVEKVKLETNMSVELNENVKIQPLASGTALLDVSIPNENLTVTNPVVNGDIIFNTAGGNLRFNTCKNLTVKSGSGNIYQPTSKRISGALTFETGSGSVEIDTIDGESNAVTSTSGTIRLGTCAGQLDIITNRANVFLSRVNNATISTTTGNIEVNYVSNSITASSTRSGDILCGKVIKDASFVTNKGDITLASTVGGNLSMISEGGHLKMVSCNNLKAITADGSLTGYQDNKIVVYGVAEIDCGKGDITINKILGAKNDPETIDNTIKSKSGAININTIVGNCKINAYNSPIKIGTTGNISITTSYSSIQIDSAPKGAIISNISGNIVVGTADNSAITTGTVDIQSSEGTINVYNTIGDVYLYSNQAVSLVNKSSNKIYINTTRGGDTTSKDTARGQVTATNLRGEVRISSQNNVSLSFAQVSNDVRVNTSGKSQSVTIDATCASASNINYLIQSSKGTISDLVIGGSISKQSSRIEKNDVQNAFAIRVYTTDAKVVLKLA